jgi:hypothetical protein
MPCPLQQERPAERYDGKSLPKQHPDLIEATYNCAIELERKYCNIVVVCNGLNQGRKPVPDLFSDVRYH